jgi:hypothetical protein
VLPTNKRKNHTTIPAILFLQVDLVGAFSLPNVSDADIDAPTLQTLPTDRGGRINHDAPLLPTMMVVGNT